MWSIVRFIRQALISGAQGYKLSFKTDLKDFYWPTITHKGHGNVLQVLNVPEEIIRSLY